MTFLKVRVTAQIVCMLPVVVVVVVVGVLPSTGLHRYSKSSALSLGMETQVTY